MDFVIFFYICSYDHVIFLWSADVMVYINLFSNIEPICVPGINPTGHGVKFFLYVAEFDLLNFVETFAPVIMKYIDL